MVYDDYGHHPTAIRETLAAVRQREPGRRVWAVYEPLTYHRTAALLDAFAEVLAGADAVAIADIWAGRDPDTTIASRGRARRRPSRAARPAIPRPRPAPSRRPPRWLAGRGPRRRRRAGHGRRPVLPHRRAARWSTWRRDDDHLRAGPRPARGPGATPGLAYDGDALHRPVRRDGRGRPRPVRAAAGRAQRRCGHT